MFEKLLSAFGYEKREGYTDALVSVLLSNAQGGLALPSQTAAIETCSGLVSRAFASSKVSGKRSEIVTPEMLSMTGRALIRNGEALFLIKPGQNTAELVPASSWSITGDYSPNSWQYDLTLAGPSKSASVKASYGDVVHVRINCDPSTPWRGASPMTSAQLTADLAASASKALLDEAAGPRGSFLPLPGGDTTGLASDVKGAKGAALLVESTASNYSASGPAPKSDFEQRRFGFSAPQSLRDAAEWSHDTLMGACGISAAMFRASDAATATAAYRHFSFSVIGPLGRLTQRELQNKLEAPDLTLDFADLKAADVQARAGAFKRLVDSGMEIERALALSGLLAD